MARLPEPGGDSGTWGGVLNDYLKVSHNDDGTLKNGAVSGSVLQNSAVSADKIATNGVPLNGQVLSYDGTQLAWTTASGSGSVPDASSTTKGIVQLAGDLGGTAASPTVPGLADKQPLIAPGSASQYYRGDKTWQTLDKAAVGLTNVDNTTDAAKPVSIATQTALDGKANTIHTHAASDITSGVIDAARLPSATDTTKGVVEIATDAEVVAGTDTTKAVTPAGLAAAVTAVSSPVLFVDSVNDIPPGTPVDTLVVVRAV